MKRFRGFDGRGRHTTTASAVRRSLAAVAVLALTAGCSAQAAVTPSVRTDDRPRGSAAPDGAPSAPPSATQSSSPTIDARPEPSEEPSASPAEVLMSEGAQGGRVRELQARLAQIGWFDDAPTGVYGRITVAAVKGFQAKRGLPADGATDTVTWHRLLGMTTEPTRGELDGKAVNKPATKLDPRCLNGRVMCVSKTTRTLSWVVDGTVRSTMDVRFGSQYTPTREGSFSVFLKSKDHVSTLYDTPMPFAMFFSGGQAVHYSSDFAARGYNGASHGCVNVRDRQAVAALYAQVRNGDKVVIHW
ncbi:L,D-transpeptidase family protein [Streptomyces sp. NPDC056500]|uniref:L,D-transpeptidase family protein n=1 Tax=Streptomyces sp. NPDC056500 TaxID=3345840 RepID=UPI003680E6D9